MTLYLYERPHRPASKHYPRSRQVRSDELPTITHVLTESPSSGMTYVEALALRLLELAPPCDPTEEIDIWTSPILWETVRHDSMPLTGPSILEPTSDTPAEHSYIIGGHIVGVQAILESNDHRFLCMFSRPAKVPRGVDGEYQLGSIGLNTREVLLTKNLFVTSGNRRLYPFVYDTPVLCATKESNLWLPPVEEA